MISGFLKFFLLTIISLMLFLLPVDGFKCYEMLNIDYNKKLLIKLFGL